MTDSMGESPGPTTGGVRHILVIGWSLVLAAGVGYVLWLGSGSGTRTFFSPETLMTRSHTERWLPFTRVAMTRSDEQAYRWRLVEFLVNEGYWTPVATSRPTWLETALEVQRARDGISRLEMELTVHREEWVGWSKGHPELARRFWPKLLGRLRRGDAAAVEEAGVMLLMARQSGSLEEFERFMVEEGWGR